MKHDLFLEKVQENDISRRSVTCNLSGNIESENSYSMVEISTDLMELLI